ncbi:DUF6414 family protein [Paenibacillus radicis (ex Gao et al. 2016)]|uniref:Uncharacterized protein n=1 Tax=Paenibacillus radicis (ex Gao et al. 2016) TaxID=1737354 RepID=A0A917MAS5_9BACL|nr:hypothetical protein [Paenibacillus radicis (ex Gao et al. 2016)]GGG88614.1 hypothetical protein GCM10010918_54000 [Paenibacillus radicis (ex Gao et al. 2016)]
MEERKLAIPIYLNQRIVFDLLAIVEEGFSQLQTIKTSEKNEKGTNADVSGEIGTKNVFAFLNLGLKSAIGRKDSKLAEKEVQEERVFTPASLFSKLRDSLIERKTLNVLDDKLDPSKLMPGAFVEFSGILKRNPMIAYMEGMIQMMEMAMLFTSQPKKQKPNTDQETVTQMKKFTGMLKQAGSLDLISEIVNVPDMKAVIPVQLEYFSNESPADIIDGQFFVLGKVVRFIPEESNGFVNLLRGTPLAYIPEEALTQVTSGFREMSSQLTMEDDFTTKVHGPVLLIVPIAIYA